MQIFTSRWNAGNLILGSEAGAVSISLGTPRFSLPFIPIGSIPELMPERKWMHSPLHLYKPLYLAKLESAGVDRIQRELARVVKAAPTGKVALLCWENVLAPKPGEFCHRRLFADWWLEKTGELIEELTPAHVTKGRIEPAPKPSAKAKPRREGDQPSLFEC